MKKRVNNNLPNVTLVNMKDAKDMEIVTELQKQLKTEIIKK